IPSALVTDSAGNPLDGNLDGVAGGDLTFDFFVLSGDANHDRTVDASDLAALAGNWQQSGRTFAQGDFNYDGTVNALDLLILSSRWQTTLASPQLSAQPAADLLDLPAPQPVVTSTT